MCAICVTNILLLQMKENVKITFDCGLLLSCLYINIRENGENL